MATSNDPLTILSEQTTDITLQDEHIITIKDDDDKYSVKSREVWRPYDVIQPKEGEWVIIRTKNSSLFHCKMTADGPVRHRHGVDLPVAEPYAWIHAPYCDLTKYYHSKTNKDVPVDMAFVWLMRDYRRVNKELKIKNAPATIAQEEFKELQFSFQRSESKNASLVSVNSKLSDENHELQNLIAQRNDELTKVDSDLEQAYAEIADLKHQLLSPSLSKGESLELTRLRMQTQLDAKDKTKLTGRISNLENTIRQLRENAIQREEELGLRIESLQRQLTESTASKELEAKLHDLESKYKLEVISHSECLKDYEMQIKKLTGENVSLNSQNNQLRENNKNLKAQIKDYQSKVNELHTHAVAPKVSSDSLQWITKYNTLSTRYTKVVNLFRQFLRRAGQSPMTTDTIVRFRADLIRINDNSIVAEPCSAPTPVQSSTSALPTPSVEEKPKPRIIHIPRVNFLKIPHVGAATIDTIAPLLARFNVIID